MTPRHHEILREIVETYIDTGEPVASRSLARRRTSAESLSAASIRNVMADLEDDGFLSHPHTSAGRVPTEKAYRAYVQSITLRRLAAAEIDRLRAEFGRLDTVEERVERTSRMLTELTRGVGLAATIPNSNPALHQIEFVALPDRRVLTV